MAKETQKTRTRRNLSLRSLAKTAREARVFYGKLLGYILPYKGRFALGVIFAVLSGMFNGVMLIAFQIIFTVVLPGSASVKKKIPFLGEIDPSQWLSGDNSQNFAMVLAFCAMVPLLIAIRGGLTYIANYCMLWVGNRILFDMRNEVFSALLRQSLSFYNSAKTGALIQTVFNQTRMAQTAAIKLAHDVIKHPVAILSIVVILIMWDPLFTLCSLVVFPLCLLPVMLISRRMRSAGGKEEQEAGNLMVTMQETFAGIRIVKAHAREDYECRKFNSANRNMLGFIMRWRKAMEIVGPLVETVASFGIAAGLFYAWFRSIDAGQFLLMCLALTQIYPHAKALSQLQILLQKCVVAASRVFDLMDLTPDIVDAPDAIELKEFRKDIRFEKVKFAYGSAAPAVRKINLTFDRGKSYALVGRSGAGKSTLFSLLLRFYDPVGGSNEGRITIDGCDIREFTQRSLRDNIGVVSQDTFLFHDTIYRNILYGRLDATREEIEEAARQAFAHEFILEQSDGYDTVVGDKGCALSGGQQQRISIARAFLRNPPILLLDEAYSALDSESEHKIQTALEHLAEGKTVIAIAHRLSTILNADQIIVMERGRVTDQGRHDELLERSNEYRRLYDLQFRTATAPAPAPPVNAGAAPAAG